MKRTIILLVCICLLFSSCSYGSTEQRIQLTGSDINDFVSVSMTFEPIYSEVIKDTRTLFSAVKISIIPKGDYSFENVVCSVSFGGAGFYWEVLPANTNATKLSDGHIIKLELDKNGYREEYIVLQQRMSPSYEPVYDPRHPANYRWSISATANGTVIKRNPEISPLIIPSMICGTIGFSTILLCVTCIITRKRGNKNRIISAENVQDQSADNS